MRYCKKLVEIQDVLELLWRDSEVEIPAMEGRDYHIVYSRPAGFFDVVMTEESEPVGFITMKYEGEGVYSIVNETKKNPHPGFVNTPGHGIEVKEKFRKRGIGKALLSLGIGLVQRDWREHKKNEGRFTVVASDVTDSGLGCYQNFGFIVKEGMAVTKCFYVDSERVPELGILARRASFWKRLKKRLRMFS
ncbi:MAG: GNAT family N-acetyltransferase [Desulfobulbaceae bacterium]|nr:GNAT family N-acetyltransferase [Desulfobulbaceae bacterium]